MEDAMSENDKRDRSMRALEIASVSGFMVSLRNIQASCLGLCNACRECAPVHRLKISRRGPPAFLAMLFPHIFHPEVVTASRVVPPRRVLKVEIRDRRWSPDNRHEQGGEEAEAGMEDPADLSLVGVRWPVGTKEIHCLFVNECIDRMTWPVGLEVLGFCLPHHGLTGGYMGPAEGLFNSPLDNSRFPSGLREIFLGIEFNQSIEGVAWPQALERLSLPGFNQSIQGVRWPVGLRSLEFMTPSEILVRKDPSLKEQVTFQPYGFNKPLGRALPSSVETLWLSDCFSLNLDGVVLPRGLVSLALGQCFPSTSFSGVSWPPGLQTVYTMIKLDDENALPDGCSVVTLCEDVEEEDYWEFCNMHHWSAVSGEVYLGQYGLLTNEECHDIYESD